MERKVTISPFCLAGISIRTSNAKNQAAEDLGKLWQDFYQKSIPSLIENPLSEEVIAVYTAYESDYRGAYTGFIGLKVDTNEKIPNGLEKLEISGGSYLAISVKGEPSQSIPKAWVDIWAREDSLKRKYTADFEVYGEESNKGPDSNVTIYLAIDQT
ncbi:GyrI-like domain-containing protein [Algoriphagus namhaensis]|uniref:GyrI-like domain-containing protein n=1 Tax=Algoriphagus namhaensis TaxID=915353 RepID=A0ABV8ANW5_9BACT